ncbi:Methyltransferase type 11 [Kribbella flavida DSM 17836]|uniref:Methyltransferase type 11 n=1 Tax=Kribbella flavida (strain DSM 17836 / JCM 10339 / NBRC 14399) TaxID=479435 RepID=D2PVE0_KRIFD|nr:class I SAM-dependent methyltransferase [Kribbella flavida]ADB33421.1 Methyltransferase type 11 [Kribbella flavida DSM 17836]
MDIRGSSGQGGSGPGAITPDGSAVELYLRSSSQGEEQVIDEAIERDSEILELGCGTGRITRPLLARGHRLVAVDESPDMVGRVTGIETVCARIEELRLDRRFDVVLMMSFLINAPDAEARRRLLATCAYHVRPGGQVILQQHDRASFAGPRVLENGNRRLVISDVEHLPGDVDAATMTHTVDGHTWSQRVVVQNLTEDQLTAALGEVGLELAGYLTQDRTWLTARPARRTAPA